jgi:hypothetical protein
MLPDLGESVPWPGVDEFLLVGRGEGLGGRIVVSGGAPAHRTDDATSCAEISEFLGCVLTAAVAVEDHPLRWLAGEQHGGEGLDEGSRSRAVCTVSGTHSPMRIR